MIIEVEGDILFSKAKAIAHGVAANDPMSEGLAKSLHQKVPLMHKEFHHWCHLHHPSPGEAWKWLTDDGVYIINLITQEGGYGRGARPGKASITYVNHSLRALRKIISKENISSLALPRLATGVGGLDWSDVLPLIHEQLGELDIPIFVYSKYLPGKIANEDNL